MSVAPKKSQKDKLVGRSIGLTSTQWDELEALRAVNGYGDMSDQVRVCLALGITAEQERLAKKLEYQKQQKVIRKLDQRQGRMLEAISALEADLGKDHPQVKVLRECLID